MSPNHPNNYPKLHNAIWAGVVGKGPDSEPLIDLDTMLDLTAAAEVDGVRFDGVDLMLVDPHLDVGASDGDLKGMAEKLNSRNLVVGTLAAPVWPPAGGGSAMGDSEERKQFLRQVQMSCHIAKSLKEIGVRPNGIVRIDSAVDPATWAQDPEGNTKRIAATFREACAIAEDYGEKLGAEGEICWGGMHSWKRMLELLELVDRKETLGFHADMAHTLLYTLGYNAPEDRILPEGWNWEDPAQLDDALATLTRSLRPWTNALDVAQNDATVKGAGSHDKTGRHCLPNDPNGKLDIAKHAGHWLREENGDLTRAIRDIRWDGCMFPNAVLMQPQTWNDILSALLSVRDAHGWQEGE